MIVHHGRRKGIGNYRKTCIMKYFILRLLGRRYKRRTVWRDERFYWFSKRWQAGEVEFMKLMEFIPEPVSRIYLGMTKKRLHEIVDRPEGIHPAELALLSLLLDIEQERLAEMLWLENYRQNPRPVGG
jgi:hypothetical protein